jgi:hypothetical protein
VAEAEVTDLIALCRLYVSKGGSDRRRGANLHGDLVRSRLLFLARQLGPTKIRAARTLLLLLLLLLLFIALVCLVGSFGWFLH